MGTTPQIMTVLVWRDEPDALLVSTQAVRYRLYVCQQEGGREGGRERGKNEEQMKGGRDKRGVEGGKNG